jgi:hypothetical protein
MKNQEMTEELTTLRRIETLVATITRVLLADKIAKVMKNADHRFIYEHTGSMAVKELSRRTGLGTGTISRLWSQWEQDGLIVKHGKSYRRVF